MSQINILATLQNHCLSPQKAIFKGKDGTKLKIDYWIDDTTPVSLQPPVQKNLNKTKSDGTVTFTKPGRLQKSLQSWLKKENLYLNHKRRKKK
jgi:hypothetical protein